jgi:signal transduction histidine kinase
VSEDPARDRGYRHIHRVMARASREADAQHALESIAAGVSEVVGFQIASISRLGADGQLEVKALSGSDEAREALLGRRTPLAVMQAELDRGERWGMLRFIPAEEVDGSDVPGWVPTYTPETGPEAWLAEDTLVAPLVDDSGTMLGILSVDLPLDGRRPGTEKQRLLEEYALQASTAIADATARDELAERVWLAEATRQIVRIASAEMNISRIVENCQAVITEAFAARGLWIQTFDEDGIGRGAVHAPNREEMLLPPSLVDIAVNTAHVRWKEQAVVVMSTKDPTPAGMEDAEFAQIAAFLESIGVSSMMFVPLGAGPEALGNLVLTRSDASRPWTTAEQAAGLDVGHDLGRILLNARLFEREQQLVDELTRLDDYKSRLIATISHELKSPLTSILGHVEMLEETPVDDGVRSSLDSIGRSSFRLRNIVEDLLTLSRVSNPSQALPTTAVDLRELVDSAFDLLGIQAAQKNLTLCLVAPSDHPVVAYGDHDELDRVCANLVSNAIKYTPAGRTVTVTLRHRDDAADHWVVLEVVDEGIGISEQDQKQLFQEFFRSTNPEARALPGTGLGLAIVEQIVERHGGRIKVRSELGAGSTFRVVLPAAPDQHR